MDNREELLDALNDFSRKQPKEIPPLLEQFLKQVAKTGETLFPWTLLKPLFVAKLEQVMAEFGQEFASEPLPPCPNVENARFEVYKSRIMEAVHRFNGAPFTIQRLCELLTDPRRHYKRCDKFLRGLEKNVLVVSTVDPFGRKVVSESKNLMNGMDSANSVDEAQNTATTSNSATPPVPSWTTSSPTTVWPVNADAVITSTSPLLEVSDLPDPKEAVANSAAATATTTATPTSQEPPAQVNGHHSVSSSVEVKTDSESGNVTSAGSPDKSEAVASSVVTPVTSVAETVDSSDQLVAAEEMVGVEEEGAATSTAISQQSAPGMAEETVVETAPAAAEVSKEEAADAKESRGEATSAASEDCSSNATDNPPAPSTSSDPGQSSDTSTPDTATPDTSTTEQTATDSDTAKTTQDTDNTEAEAAGREGGAETVNGAEGESVSASKEDAESAMEKTVSEDENISDSSASQPEAAASESEPAPSETSQTKTLTATSDTTETPQSSSSTADTTTATTTTSTQGPEANSSNEQSEVSTAAEAEPAETMETDSGDASSNASQAAERSDSSSAPSDSDTKDASQMESDVSDSTATAEPMEHD